MTLILKICIFFPIASAFIISFYFVSKQDNAALACLYSHDAAKAAQCDPDQAIYSKTLGDQALMESPPRLDAAAMEYKKALLAAPCSLVQWRDWGNINMRLNQLDIARKAFETGEFLAPNESLVQLDFGNLLLAEKLPKDAARHHQRAIELTPSMAPAIYPAYLGTGWTPMQVTDSVLTKNTEVLRRYLLQCLTWLDPKRTIELWEHINQVQPDAFDADSHRRYFDFLIANKEYAPAKVLWGNIVSKFYDQLPKAIQAKGNELWNGNFELPPLFDGGLEWRIEKSLPAGASAVVTSSDELKPNQQLWIHFGGEENTTFCHVRHLFFVEPGKTYRLEYHAKTLALTTDNGLYVKVTIASNPPLVVKGQIVRGTGEWTLKQEFAAPLSAQCAEISICRDRSQKLDNRIKGDVWFDDFSLGLLGETPIQTGGNP